MRLQATVLREWRDKPYRTKAGVEVVPHVLTLIEAGSSPLLQLCDYVLLPEELGMFGTTQGKVITLEVQQVRSIFSGRPRFEGKITVDGTAKK